LSSTEVATSTVPYFPPRDYIRDIGKFDEIIDVRSPDEFREDHIPGAINLPVLNNDQRAEVGTLHNTSKLKPRARQVGAAYISANISTHLTQHFLGKDLTYKPLIYCWRGGHRSRSLALVLSEIGFCPWLLQGGWKQYRSLVREGVTLTTLPGQLDDRGDQWDRCSLILVSGPTGSGKSLLLETLQKRGEQILHLEQLAKHKGSTLGNYPGEQQPKQKMFESLLWHQIVFQFKSNKVIWVENESAKVGKIAVPNRIWKKMCQSPRIHIEADLEDRVKHTMKDYSYFCDGSDEDNLVMLLEKLEKHAGKKKSQEWIDLVRGGKFQDLTRELIVDYYDKNYKTPRGQALQTFQVPKGLLLDQEKLLSSSFIDEIISFGDEFVTSKGDTGSEHQAHLEEARMIQ